MSATKDGECEQRVRVRHGTDGHTDNDHHCIMPTPYGSGCIILTSCRREAATICPHPDLQVMTRHTSYTHLDPLLTRCPCWPAKYSQPKRPGDLDLWPFDLESGVRVTCNVGYLYANFGLPGPLCSRLRPDVRDRQTSDRQIDRQTDRETDVRLKHHRLMPSPIRGGGTITSYISFHFYICTVCVYSVVDYICWSKQRILCRRLNWVA